MKCGYILEQYKQKHKATSTENISKGIFGIILSGSWHDWAELEQKTEISGRRGSINHSVSIKDVGGSF